MYNISFKTLDKDKKVIEEGFDTTFSNNIEDVVKDLHNLIDLEEVSTVEILINPLTWPKQK